MSNLVFKIFFHRELAVVVMAVVVVAVVVTEVVVVVVIVVVVVVAVAVVVVIVVVVVVAVAVVAVVVVEVVTRFHLSLTKKQDQEKSFEGWRGLVHSLRSEWVRLPGPVVN